MADEPIVDPNTPKDAPPQDPPKQDPPVDPNTPKDAPKDPPKEPPKDPAPIEYDTKAFKVPEGMALDEAALGNALPLFKEAKLDQATAQKFIDLYAAQMKGAGEAGAKAWADTIGKWQGEFKTSLADSKEFTGAEHGGDRVKEVQALTAKAVTAYGGEDAAALLQHMKTYALGDYGPMARFMARVGRTVKEDSAPRPNGAAATPISAQALYPKSNMNP